jgi:hypothetical protein
VIKDYPSETIDVAIVSTIRMLTRGKVISWKDAKMYVSNNLTYINDAPIGDIVDATLVWFVWYSPANPYKSNWGETQSSIDFLKRRFI